jgi:hypothetical protein
MNGQDWLARGRQLQRVVARDGARGLALRVTRRVERTLATGTQPSIGLHLQDVVDSTRLPKAAVAEPVRDRPLRIGWVTSPPSGGSGGHTTMLRMVQGLEAAGHECSLYLYDVYDGDVAAHERVVRTFWPQIRAQVRDVRDGLPQLDAWVATSWETAHVLAARPTAGGKRFYFVQDYEPFFYAHGAERALAEDTYRFGFHGITAGGWLAEELQARFGMTCDFFEFGTDTDIYRLPAQEARDGVVFYAKPDVPRRGFTLGVLALREFAQTHPEVSIHLFGEPVTGLPFPTVSHGRVTPAALSDLYGRCRVGLSLSLTNISLIPWELLACGVIPVVNDAKHNRRVLDNDYVTWSPLSVSGIAAALSTSYAAAADPHLAPAAAASIRSTTWDGAANVVTGCIETVVRS